MPNEKKPETKSPLGDIHQASIDRSWEPVAQAPGFPTPYPTANRDAGGPEPGPKDSIGE